MPFVRKVDLQRSIERRGRNGMLEVDLGIEPASPGFSAAEEAEAQEWLEDGYRHGYVEDVTPHPLTDHIAGPGRPSRKP